MAQQENHKILKYLLSRSPFETLIYAIMSFLLIFLISHKDVNINFKIIFGTLLFLTIYGFLIKDLKRVLISSVIFVGIAISASYLTLGLESKYTGITGTLFPLIFSLYYGCGAIYEFKKNELKQQIKSSKLFNPFSRLIFTFLFMLVIGFIYSTYKIETFYLILPIALVFFIIYYCLLFVLESSD